MNLTIRQRVVLTLVPLLLLLAGLGVAAVVLLNRLGGRANAILRENYDSVLFMERLNEAVERIDSSFTFALAGEEKLARGQYAEFWQAYRYWQRKENNNITEPGEDELVQKLNAVTGVYRKKGQAFYARPAGDPGRRKDYFGPGGLLSLFGRVKRVSEAIRELNQKSMEQASRDARETAHESLIGLLAGLAATAAAATWLAGRTAGAVLRPVRAVTESALAIGGGNLDQVVPVVSNDELGRLAEAFNQMARQLRHYRQSDYSRLIRAQRTSQATIDSFPHPVLVVDAEGRVEMANPAAQHLFGVTSAPPGKGGPTAAPVWQPPEALREPLREALRGQRPYLPEGFDRVIPLPVDGQDQFFLPRLLPIGDPFGNSLGAAVLLENVTRYRLLDQVKNDLVATVSHELKTPLTGLRLALHLLLEEAVGPLTPKQTELLLDARDNAERLLARVNNLLDLARLEQGRSRLELRPESPAALLEAAAEAVRPRARDKGVAIAVEAAADLPPVAADAGRLGHALGNLLDNALAHTGAGGKITLAAAAADGGVTLSVADTGAGIPPEYLPHVFDKFFRIPGRSPEGGTGLGLAIVREIVTAHGGAVTCESHPGSGTVFRISLPARAAGPGPEPAPEAGAVAR